MHTPVSLLDKLRLRPDSKSWQELVDLYRPWLCGWLRTHRLQTADVDDMVQEVLTVLVRELPDFRHNGRTGAFRTWLRGIVVHRLREFRRKAAACPVLTEDPLEELADDHSRLSEQWAREHDEYVVKKLLARIEGDFQPLTWQAFRSFVLEQQPAAAVAARLNMTPSAVWTAKSHVLKRLRQEAGNWLD